MFIKTHMITLSECLRDIAATHQHPIAWISVHKPILTILAGYLTHMDVMSLHGAFEGFDGANAIMPRQYWHRSFNPAVLHIQKIMLTYNRVDVARALRWHADVMTRTRIEQAVACKCYELVEFYAELALARGCAHMCAFVDMDARMVAGVHMHALMLVMPDLLLKAIAYRFIRVDNTVTHDIMRLLDSADYHIANTSYDAARLDENDSSTWTIHKGNDKYAIGCDRHELMAMISFNRDYAHNYDLETSVSLYRPRFSVAEFASRARAIAGVAGTKKEEYMPSDLATMSNKHCTEWGAPENVGVMFK